MIDSSIAFAHRFSELAKQEAEKERDEKRKKELEEIARICSRVPEYPAETMWEALQSIWLVHLILQIESNGHSLSYGRLDQYLYPFYKKDLEEGRVTEESACELLENLWLKTFTINKVRSWAAHTIFSRKSHVSECDGRRADHGRKGCYQPCVLANSEKCSADASFRSPT